MQIGPGHFGALHGLQVLLLLPLLMAACRGFVVVGQEPATLAKMTWGYVATAARVRHCCYWLAIMAGDIGGVSVHLVGPVPTQLLSAAELLLVTTGHVADHGICTAPQATSQAVGLWFAAAAVGNAFGRGHRFAGDLAESPLRCTAGGRVARGRAVRLHVSHSADAQRTNPLAPDRKRRSPCPGQRSIASLAALAESVRVASRKRPPPPYATAACIQKCLRFPAMGQHAKNDQTMPKSARAWPL